MLKTTLSMSERLACKAVGLARSTYRRLPLAQTPADPDAEVRAWLRAYAFKHPCHGFRRAWAALRYDERREVNKKKIHRLWCEEACRSRSTHRGSGPGCRRSHRRRQGHQDRLDDRRTHPHVTAACGRTLDHRRAAGVRTAEGLLRGPR